MNLKNMASNVSIMPKIQEFLKGLNFPVSRQDVINKAQQGGADNNIMSMLQKLPDKMFGSQSDLTNELGKINK
jgi:hypothetical protein